MQKTFTAIALAVSISLSGAAQTAQDRMLSVEQVRSDIALAEESYRRIHPGYDRYTSKAQLDTAWAAIVAKSEAQDGMSVGDFYIEVEKVLTLIRCDHTKAELPNALKEERNTIPVYLPMRWDYVGSRGFVSVAAEGVNLGAGDEILSIDGRPLAEMVSEVRPLIPVDGYTNWSSRGGVSESLEFMGGAVDHFGALLWDISPDATLEVRSPDGDVRTITVARVTFDDWTALGKAKGQVRNFKDAVTFRKLDDRTGYLSVDTFVNYRQPVKPDTLYDPVFKQIRDDGLETLILDLRKNGGGSTDARQRLLAHLIDKPMVPINQICAKTINLDGLREHLWTWDKRAMKPNPMGFKTTEKGKHCLRKFVDSDLKKLKPDSNAFTGELIILTSTDNSSASTSLSSILKGQRDVTLVGEKTGGSAEGPTGGIQFTLTLPESGVRGRIPFLRYYNNIETFEPGFGLSPDIEAPMTVEAYLAGQDPALEAALEIAAK